MKTKIIPFDLEIAKKVINGEVAGRIVAKSKKSYLPVILKQIDTISSTLNICHRYSHIEVKYGHKSMLQYLNGSNCLLIESPEETPKHEFKPFDKVLVKMNNDDECSVLFTAWTPAIFQCYVESNGDYPYLASGILWGDCISYAGNEHLLGTTDKPKKE